MKKSGNINTTNSKQQTSNKINTKMTTTSKKIAKQPNSKIVFENSNQQVYQNYICGDVVCQNMHNLLYDNLSNNTNTTGMTFAGTHQKNSENMINYLDSITNVIIPKNTEVGKISKISTIKPNSKVGKLSKALIEHSKNAKKIHHLCENCGIGASSNSEVSKNYKTNLKSNCLCKANKTKTQGNTTQKNTNSNSKQTKIGKKLPKIKEEVLKEDLDCNEEESENSESASSDTESEDEEFEYGYKFLKQLRIWEILPSDNLLTSITDYIDTCTAKNLELLDLTNCRLSDKAFKIISDSFKHSKNNNIKYLILEKNEISRESLSVLINSIEKSVNINYLSLAYCNLNIDSLLILEKLFKNDNSNLECLILKGNQILNEGACLLMTSLINNNFKSLKHININFCGILVDKDNDRLTKVIINSIMNLPNLVSYIMKNNYYNNDFLNQILNVFIELKTKEEFKINRFEIGHQFDDESFIKLYDLVKSNRKKAIDYDPDVNGFI